MAFLARRIAIVLLFTTLAAPAVPAADEADMAGAWTVEFALPWGGSASYPMWVNQNGKTLTGRVTFPGVAEHQIKGTIENDRFRMVWQTVVDGEFVDVTFAGRVAGDEMNGTARIGKYSERELYGRRTER